MIGDEQIVDVLTNLLEQHDPSLTWTITSALRKIDDPRVGLVLAKSMRLNEGGCSNLLALTQNSEKFDGYSPFDPHLLRILEESVDKSQPIFSRGLGVKAIGSYGYVEGIG